MSIVTRASSESHAAIGDGRRQSANYAEWLADAGWDHFATLTSRVPMSPGTIESHLVNSFIRNLEKRSQRRIDYFGTVELADRWHVHTVLSGTGELPVSAVENAWRLGHAHVRIYQPSARGLEYISKQLSDAGTRLLLRIKTANRDM